MPCVRQCGKFVALVKKFSFFSPTEIWWNPNINRCDKITKRAMRYYLGVHNLTPLPALYGEMDWLKLNIVIVYMLSDF